MRESTVERYFVKRVKEAGGVSEKHVSPGRHGVPDRIVLWPESKIDWVELKTVGGILSPAQKRDHARRRALGQKVFVLWTKAGVDYYILQRTKPLAVH